MSIRRSIRRRRELTNRDVHESASAISELFIQSTEWVTDVVFDVKVKVRFETLMLNDHNRRMVVDMPGAVVLGFLAVEGKKTPAVYIQPIVGQQQLFDKDGNWDGRNFAWFLIDEKLGDIISLAAGFFRIALQTKHPGLTIPFIPKRQFGVTVEKRSS